jgi:hypothetical protein
VRRWIGRHLRRHRVATPVTVLFAGLTLNVWVQDGTGPFLVVLAAVVGCALVLGSVGWLTGTQVVRHSRRVATAIEAGNHPMKELRR